MPFLQIPSNISTSVEAHNKWLQLLEQAQELIDADIDLQEKAAKGLRLKERILPPEVLGRSYAQYCDVINRMYDAYLNSVHLQRAPYLLEIISVFMKRLFELRNELVHIIVNDYIYVDASLIQLGLTPLDIEVVVPYHIPLECRTESIEQLLQKMWADAVKRKSAPPVIVTGAMQCHVGYALRDVRCNEIVIQTSFDYAQEKSELQLGEFEGAFREESFQRQRSPEDVTLVESVHTIVPEEFIQAVIIQKQERFRQFFMEDFRAKCNIKRAYFSEKVEDAPLKVRTAAAALIQRVYRAFMKLKRQHLRDEKRDILLGLISDPYKERLSFQEENNKMYERRRQMRFKIHQSYLKDLEKEKVRLIVFKKDNQIDDITEHIREWFKEWYTGYGFFPEYPYDIEGGTMMVIRGEYPTIAEKKEEDEKYMASTKGKSKEQLQKEKEQAIADAKMRAEVLKDQKKKEAEQLFKLRCNPFADPGYQAQTSEITDQVTAALQKYRATWSIYDRSPPDHCADMIYGYIRPMITEELMSQLHQDCRQFVDELMRLDLKLLIKSHQIMYQNVGWKYPKLKPRKKPKLLPMPKTLNVNGELLRALEEVFNLGIISKPTAKIKDIIGDYNYAAYDLNLQDPNPKFPPPAYGDIRRRLLLSCAWGSGLDAAASRNKSVMLLGPERNGKSFLAECVAGEMNAVKIDITPEVFSAIVYKPAKTLNLVFTAAKLFQPAVIFMKNVERVFAKKVPPQDKALNAKAMKTPLTKLLKAMAVQDKIIFIGTCTFPLTAQANPMVSLFDEMILVPRTDYGSLQLFFYEKLQSIRSIKRNYCVQTIAQLLQGYGFGLIIELFSQVMNAERIVKLNVTPLSPLEFLEPLIDRGLEPVTIQDYQEYMDFFIHNSPLKAEREEFETINRYRAVVYMKMAKMKKEG